MTTPRVEHLSATVTLYLGAHSSESSKTGTHWPSRELLAKAGNVA